MGRYSAKAQLVNARVGGVFEGEFPFEDEPDSKHRLFIVSKAGAETALCLKCTSQNKTGDPYAVELKKWQAAGFTKPTTVCCSKIGMLNIETDISGYVGELDPYEYECVCDHFLMYVQDLDMVETWARAPITEREGVISETLSQIRAASERLMYTSYDNKKDHFRGIREELDQIMRRPVKKKL